MEALGVIFALSAILFAILAGVYAYNKVVLRENVEVAALDGIKYKVVRSFKDSQLAANTMAGIYKNSERLLIHLKRKYMNDPGTRGKITRTLIDRFIRHNIYENTINGDDTAYTEDKRLLVICLRDKKSAALHNVDILTFVFIHELAHMSITTVDDTSHSKWFWTVFKFLLFEAAEAGALTPVNYAVYPEKYCGLNVDYNPYFDNSLPML